MLSPNGAHVYVANQASNTVSVIDPVSNTVTATIPTNTGPSVIAASPDNALVHVTQSGDASLGVIDTATNTVVTNIPVGAGPIGVALTPDGTRAYVANFQDNSVSVVDTAASTVTATVPVGPGPVEVAVTPDGTRAYVASTADGSVRVIDTATNTVTSTTVVGDVPVIVAIIPDGTRAYVSTAGAQFVAVMDTATNTVITTIPVPTPRVVVISPDGAVAYVTNLDSDTVSVIGIAANAVLDTLATGDRPLGVAVTPDSARLYVTNSLANTVSAISLQTIPRAGPITGGTTVIIRGHNLSGATAVHFGSATATILANTPTSVTVSSPPGFGTVPVTVTTAGGTGSFGTFTYRSAPVVIGIAVTSSPFGGEGGAQGPTGGGGTATITGLNLSGATAVHFGPSLATIVSDTDTSLTVNIPAVPGPGPVTVTVVTPGGTSNDLTFIYVDPPTLTSASPNQGPTAGGNQVTIQGTNLATAQSVTFDGVPAYFSVVSDNTIAATAPPHPVAGPVNIAVTTVGGSASSGLYEYVESPG
ncbi:IPT/TIG domain-containing protein [Streptomyces sp. ME19-01-6]|uniref:IPT/TIG domain-containing protein n=1 Tax=Streptomyces sp. ME19-01-6 TaxID=3028686 RepID=UPI0029A20797|nr:IPT/TIG domain-containing protein [Streptomyces sp. ME19-01-6]MDX3227848.1 IPT/TIG domain-containing protein [Streptomyces sp. ME19-01-6]